ncbi:unnamed protein product, partial [Didymodactylos carnosus]
KRYSRSDEIAIPFAVTIDFDSLKQPYTATLRERDSFKQIRLKIDELANVLQGLSTGTVTWGVVTSMYPEFKEQQATAAKEDSINE